MNTSTWLLRSLRFHSRQHLAVAGGAALATAVLAAALLTGDALNRELRRMALARVGAVQAVVEVQGRLVEAALADRLAQETGAPVAPVLQLQASCLAAQDDGERRVDRVKAYGVDARFFPLFRLAEGRAFPTAGDATPVPGDAWLSQGLAAALGSGHDAVSLRFAPPVRLPFDMPLGAGKGERTVRRDVRVCGVRPDGCGGLFSLLSEHIPPLNTFVGREWLAAEAGVAGRANLLLSSGDPVRLAAALRQVLTPSDVGVDVKRAPDGVWLVRSERVFLDDAHVRALSALVPAPVMTLHHLADAFVAGEGTDVRETPYGFISALSPSSDPRLGVVPAELGDDEIVINAWLAAKLRLGVGDRLTVRWRRFESGGRLTPDEAAFRVARVIDTAAAEVERARLPVFPGLTNVEHCADWDIGLPLDQAKLADPDNEAYWKAHGPTPKAFVSLAAGRLMFGTSLGSAMVARFPPETTVATITNALCRADPQALGLRVRPVRQEALAAVAQAMDFRELFTGMAVVLMVAALILTGLLASLSVEHRREEVGVLRAAGFTPRQVAFLWLAETLPTLAAGVGLGMVAGLAGAWLLVGAMNQFWSGAIAGTQMAFSFGAGSCMVAGAVALVASLLAVRWSVQGALSVPVRALLAGSFGGEACAVGGGRASVRREFAIGLGTAAVALALLAAGMRGAAGSAAGLFFGAGLLLMISLLCLARLLVLFLGSNAAHPATGPVRAGVLNIVRQPGRSLLVMVLLASGSFLAVGVLAMKQDPAAGFELASSGSGGFEWLVETALPLPGNQGDATVRRALGDHARLLAFRVHAGDEAGCLNLNRAVQPNLLGVDTDDAAALRAFDTATDGPSVWSLLAQPMRDGTLPALAGDLTTVTYGLHTQAGLRDGGVFVYTGEDGTEWKLRIVGALPVRTGVLQGSLIVDEDLFARLYPSAPGHGLWLARGGLGMDRGAVAERLRQDFGRSGGLVTSTRERLRALGAVESTYLDMFLVLGGLGMVLGAAGTGLVMWRNVVARRRELAVLRAVGLPARQMLVYLLAEHLYLLLAGLVSGVLPALVAVQPALHGLRSQMPVAAMAASVVAMFAAGVLGTLAAVWAAARTDLQPALRGE